MSLAVPSQASTPAVLREYSLRRKGELSQAVQAGLRVSLRVAIVEADPARAAALDQLLGAVGVPRERVRRPDPERHPVAVVPARVGPPDPTVTSIVLGARGADGGTGLGSSPGTSSGVVRAFGRVFPVAGPMYTPPGSRVDSNGFISAAGDAIYLGLDPVSSALEFYSGRGGPCGRGVPPLDSMADLLRRLMEACYYSWDLPFVRLWPHPLGADYSLVGTPRRRLSPAPDGSHWIEFIRSGGRGVVTSLRSVGDRPCAGTTFPFRPMPRGQPLPILEIPQSRLTVETRSWGLVALSSGPRGASSSADPRAYASWWVGRLSVEVNPGFDGRELWVDLNAEGPIRGIAVEISVAPGWAIGAVECRGLVRVRRVGESRVVVIVGELAGREEVRAAVRR